MNLLRGTLLSMALLTPSLAQAAAGQVLFALGRVEIERNGQTLAAPRGTPVEVGDVVSTGPTGLAQLRMQDGALLSLRYGSTLKVEDYRMPAAAAPAPAPGAAAPAASGGRSALRLLRGAFRTVTGLIGRSRNDAYSVVTPVATIGIRGTDYSAAYCSGDCGGTADGLYLGVSNGGIDVTNDAGQLALGNDQYGYVRDGATPPARELAPPAVLDAPIPPEGEDAGDETETASADDGSGDAGFRDFAEESPYETGEPQPEGDYEVRSGGQPAGYAYASNGIKGSAIATVFSGSDGGLLGFEGDVSASIGSAANFDVGGHAASGLLWGRWHGGTATVVTANGASPLDLTSASLHWIYAADEDRAALPITGSQSYTLVGGTNPTDAAGNVGTLGSASLFADFTNLVVVSNLSLTMPGVSAPSNWSASGTGSITSDTFSGSYTVTVDGVAGSGGFAGFFTGGGTGAGMTFELQDSDFVTTVNGAAGFVAGSPAGGP